MEDCSLAAGVGHSGRNGSITVETSPVDESIRQLRIAIVDDHQMLLDGLSRWVNEGTSRYEIPIKVKSWDELLSHPEYPVDVVLLDLELHDSLPVDMKVSAMLAAGCKVVIITTLAEPTVIRSVLKAGASGFVPKSESAQVLIQAIDTVMSGEVFLTPEVEQLLVDTADVERIQLAPREQEVVQAYLGGLGLTLTQVASQLDIRVSTVETYIKRIKRKYSDLGIYVGTKMELRAQLLSDGWIVAE